LADYCIPVSDFDIFVLSGVVVPRQIISSHGSCCCRPAQLPGTGNHSAMICAIRR